jgi:ribonuclease P protein component
VAGRVWRIRDRTTFQQLRAQGRRVRRGPITVTWLADSGATAPRVAFAVGRRVGTAVRRNRLRRRLRAVVADQAPTLPPGAYLIGAGPAAAEMTNEELRSIVSRAVTALAEEGGR